MDTRLPDVIRVVKGRDGLGSLLVHLTRLCSPFSRHRERYREGRTDSRRAEVFFPKQGNV